MSGFKVLLNGRIVPTRKIGDEVEQCKAQNIPVRFVVAIENAFLSHRLPLDPSLVIAALTQFLAMRRSRSEIEDDLRCTVAKTLWTERIGRVGPERGADDRATGSQRPARPPYMEGGDARSGRVAVGAEAWP